jgi:hypothetical protein
LFDQIELDKSVEDLLDSFSSFCSIINSFSSLLYPDKDGELKNVLERASKQMTEVAYFVSKYCRNQSFCKPILYCIARLIRYLVKRVLKNQVSGAADSIEEYRANLDKLKEEFQLRLQLRTGASVNDTKVEISEIGVKVVRVLQAVEDIGMQDLYWGE